MFGSKKRDTTSAEVRTTPVPETDRDGVDYVAHRRSYAVTRAVVTLLSAAVAGLLVWLAHTFDLEVTGEYWAIVGLLAAAGLALALGQLFGGWTKWGWPRLSVPVFLLGFLPALVVGGVVLLANQPDGAAFQETAADVAEGLGIAGVIGALGEHLGPIAFGLGVLFGFTFDTTGPRIRPAVDRRTAVAPVRAHDRGAADEPLVAERETVDPVPAESDRDEVAMARTSEPRSDTPVEPGGSKPDQDPPPRRDTSD